MRRWRVYYNWRQGLPKLGAVDNGTIKSQRTVEHVTIHASVGDIRSASNMKHAQNEPTWWLEMKANAVFEGVNKNRVTFYGEAKPMEQRMREATRPQFGGER